MMTNFQEFSCKFADESDDIDEPKFIDGQITIDLTTVIAFNPWSDKRYTVLRCIDGQSYIVKCDYKKMKDRIESFAIRFAN